MIRIFLVLFCAAQFAYGDTAPCDLLTPGEINAGAGVSAGAGSPIANTGCSWRATGKSKLVVTVSMQSEAMFAGAKRGVAPNASKKAVSGIGDEAIFVGLENFSSLWVRKGGKFLLVRVYGLGVGEAEAKIEALGKSAVSKL